MVMEPAEPPATVPLVHQAEVLEDARLLWPSIAQAIQCIEDLAEHVSGMLMRGSLQNVGHPDFPTKL